MKSIYKDDEIKEVPLDTKTKIVNGRRFELTEKDLINERIKEDNCNKRKLEIKKNDRIHFIKQYLKETSDLYGHNWEIAPQEVKDKRNLLTLEIKNDYK